MTYQPPRHPLAVLQQLNWDEAIAPDDPRFVDTDAARDYKAQVTLARKFGLDTDNNTLYATTRKHALLFGPIGCGKSTELWRFKKLLERGRKLYPVMLNLRNEVDINNLQYADMLMALATAVLNELESRAIDIDAAGYQQLEAWFSEHVITQESLRELTGQLQSEAGMEGGIPFIAKFLSKVTVAFKNSSSRKDTLRETIKNTFTQFAQAFNRLIQGAEQGIQERGLGERLLLIVDGTDKIPMEDAERLFVSDTEQLLAIQALVLYTAPISLKYGGTTHSKLDVTLVLPIIKLESKDKVRHEAGWQAMRDMLTRRIDPAAFTDPALMDRLIEYSGGHPRELLRLLSLACELTESDLLDEVAIEQAINRLAGDFRYWLEPEDYVLLAKVDRLKGQHAGNDERTRNLLWRLALLHYNDGSWRLPHPVIRRLEGFRQASSHLLLEPDFIHESVVQS